VLQVYSDNETSREKDPMSCPVCENESDYALTKDGCAYFKCSRCSFLFHKGATGEPTLPSYDHSYWNMERIEALRREREDCFHRALELIYLSTIRIENILDFGCGSGVTVSLLRDKLGINAVGVDPFGEFNESDFLHKCTLQELCLKYPPGHFDAIYSVEVFEHLVAPRETMAALHYFLKPGGKLLINTGTQEFLAKYDPDANYIDPLVRGHISIYSLESFSVLARALGLRARFLGDRKYMVLLEEPIAKEPYPEPANLATLARLGDWVPPLFTEYMRLIQLEKEFADRTVWALSLDQELSALRAGTKS
jgi:SAM-dependent methyltransferase